MNRSEAREQALGILYAAEQTGTDPDSAGAAARTRRLVDGVWSRKDELDALIGRTASAWRVERMAPVDLTVLRIGLYELLAGDTPTGVVIAEALRLAGTYSTENSGRFVNGVLAALAREVRPEG